MNEGRIIAVGDIHGCSVALATLIEAIESTPLDTLIFLGDFIDRGPNSKGVIEQVIRLSDQCQVVPLLGNHEEMLLGALEGKDNVPPHKQRWDGLRCSSASSDPNPHPSGKVAIVGHTALRSGEILATPPHPPAVRCRAADRF